MMHPTRSEINVDSFNEAGNTFKTRALIECKRIFYNNKSEITFAYANADFCMNLSNRESASLVLDKGFVGVEVCLKTQMNGLIVKMS